MEIADVKTRNLHTRRKEGTLGLVSMKVVNSNKTLSKIAPKFELLRECLKYTQIL